MDDLVPDQMRMPSVRANGTELLTVLRYKKGRTRDAAGAEVFDVVEERFLNQEVKMLKPLKDVTGVPAQVTVGRGMTLPFPDEKFAFVRADLVISVPVTADAKAIEEAVLNVTAEVEARMEAQVIRLRGNLQDKANCVKAGLLRLTDFDAGEARQVEALLK